MHLEFIRYTSPIAVHSNEVGPIKCQGLIRPSDRPVNNTFWMKLRLYILLLIVFSGFQLKAQKTLFDSLQQELLHMQQDTSRVLVLAELENQYTNFDRRKTFSYFREALELSQSLNYQYGVWISYQNLFGYYNNVADYSNLLQSQLNALKVAERLTDRRLECMARTYTTMSYMNRIIGNYEDALKQMRLAVQCQQLSGKPLAGVAGAFTNGSLAFLGLHMPDSAAFYLQKGIAIYPKNTPSFALVLAMKGNVEEEQGKLDSAVSSYRHGIDYYTLKPQNDNGYYLMRLYISLASLFAKMGKGDSCVHYAELAYQISRNNQFTHYELQSSKILWKYYESKNSPDSVVKYLKAAMEANDSVFSQGRMRQIQALNFSEEQRQRDIEAAKQKIKDQIRFYAVLAALGVFLLLAFILYRNNRQQKEANRMLKEQKQEIETALSELKTTQNQLVQSEKMASLGELTAGIAHEIQNPLNFVNNFSELNTELIDEFDKALIENNKSDMSFIAQNLRQNLEKISSHGKRAGSIVKSMLQHSQKTSGQLEATDLNALIEEYARLSYHGFRAREKLFNATIDSELDPSLGKVNLISQDMGRVLLNLFNNAFYSMSEKLKASNHEYQPLLSIKTKKDLNKAEIRIRDNGMGIQQEILDKIFQPFFTTKPAGQGTGLGLSLSFDIIRSLGGEIRAFSAEGQGAEFMISLPV